jgi:hypothetical protein
MTRIRHRKQPIGGSAPATLGFNAVAPLGTLRLTGSALYDYENVDFATNWLGVEFLFTKCDLAVTFLNVADTTVIFTRKALYSVAGAQASFRDDVVAVIPDPARPARQLEVAYVIRVHDDLTQWYVDDYQGLSCAEQHVGSSDAGVSWFHRCDFEFKRLCARLGQCPQTGESDTKLKNQLGRT